MAEDEDEVEVAVSEVVVGGAASSWREAILVTFAIAHGSKGIKMTKVSMSFYVFVRC